MIYLDQALPLPRFFCCFGKWCCWWFGIPANLLSLAVYPILFSRCINIQIGFLAGFCSMVPVSMESSKSLHKKIHVEKRETSLEKKTCSLSFQVFFEFFWGSTFHWTRSIPIGGGNWNIFGIFTPILGEDEPNLTFAYFSKGLVQPPTRSLFLIHVCYIYLHEP